MGHEIERKFLVDAARWQPADAGTLYRQGYLSRDPERTVRVRIEGDRGRLTIKGRTVGVTRVELEYPIPLGDAETLIGMCDGPVIEKRRHRERYEGKDWEIDVFAGDNAGLVVAELELGSEDEAFATPPWAIREVSDDPRYYNSNLSATPYTRW